MNKRVRLKDPLIAVTVVGAGMGESIVINVGGAILGAIDCCETRPRQSATLDVVKRSLEGSQAPRIGFVLLTHPHLDHFAGMKDLLIALRERAECVGFFAGTTELELARIAEGATGPDWVGLKYKYFRQFDELLRVYRHELQPKQRISLSDKSEVLRATCVTGRGREIDFSVSCLAPSDDDSRSFLDQVRTKNIVDTAGAVGGRPAQLCNQVSLVTRIDFGSTRLLFGGDAELKSWDQILDKYVVSQLQCNLLKVSHHGSRTAVSPSLAKALAKTSKNQDTIAVVTPSTLHGLPHRESLRHLKKAFDRVEVTGSRGFIGRAEVQLRWHGAKNIRGGFRPTDYSRTYVFDSLGRHIDRRPSWTQTVDAHESAN